MDKFRYPVNLLSSSDPHSSARTASAARTFKEDSSAANAQKATKISPGGFFRKRSNTGNQIIKEPHRNIPEE